MHDSTSKNLNATTEKKIEEIGNSGLDVRETMLWDGEKVLLGNEIPEVPNAPCSPPHPFTNSISHIPNLLGNQTNKVN